MALPDESLHDFPDRSIRHQLENASNLRDLLRAAVPDLADRFDFTGVECLERAFPLDDWRQRESDMVFRIPYQEESGTAPVLVCVLIEHQSQPDPRLPLRMLVYTVLHWEREWKVWEETPAPRPALRLTPVLPIVFHTGTTRWRTNKEFAELVGGPEAFRQFAPRWQPVFWDLAERTPEELLTGDGEWLQALAVVRAEREDAAAFAHVLEEALRRLEKLEERDKVRWHELLRFLLSWALYRRPAEERDSLIESARTSQVQTARQMEVQAVSQTIAEWLVAKGRAEGRAEGKAEGIVEGIAEGIAEGQLAEAREILRSLLEEKFSTLPGNLLERIHAATSLEKLRATIRRIGQIRSPDELQL